MKLLVDAGMGRKADTWLKRTSHDVACVRDVDPRMPDHGMLAWALRERRVLISIDKCFVDMVYAERLPHCGVLVVRLDSEAPAEKIAALDAILANYGDDLRGHLCVYQGGRLRVR